MKSKPNKVIKTNNVICYQCSKDLYEPKEYTIIELNRYENDSEFIRICKDCEKGD